MAPMRGPPHAGTILKEDILPELGLTETEVAKKMNVTRVTLSRILNGRASISVEMALRIEAWLGIKRGGRAEVWAGMQMAYDLWQARQKRKSAA